MRHSWTGHATPKRTRKFHSPMPFRVLVIMSPHAVGADILTHHEPPKQSSHVTCPLAFDQLTAPTINNSRPNSPDPGTCPALRQAIRSAGPKPDTRTTHEQHLSRLLYISITNSYMSSSLRPRRPDLARRGLKYVPCRTRKISFRGHHRNSSCISNKDLPGRTTLRLGESYHKIYFSSLCLLACLFACFALLCGGAHREQS